MPLSEAGRELRDRLFHQATERILSKRSGETKAALDSVPRKKRDYRATIALIAPIFRSGLELVARAFLEATLEAFETEGAALTLADVLEIRLQLIDVINSDARRGWAILDEETVRQGNAGDPTFSPTLAPAEKLALSKITNELEIYSLRRKVTDSSTAPATPKDGLTSLRQRAELEDDLTAQIAHATPDAPLAVLFSDIDHFKDINDTHGHDVGDAALRGVAACFRVLCDRRGATYRYGGEEFVVVLPATMSAEAMLFAERLRGAVEKLAIPEIGRPVTVSIGIAITESSDVTAAALLKDADAAMYRSKDGGRNRVTLAVS